MNRPLRCLIIEALPYHWEVLGPWVYLLKCLEIDVEIAIGQTAGHQETLRLLGLPPAQVHDVQQLDALPMERFDFVLLNTLVHAGYFFSPEPVPRPDLQLLGRLQLPSICVIHEPIQWMEKRVVHSFTIRGQEKEEVIHLLADGSSVREGGFWSLARWAMVGDRLSVPFNDGIRTFLSSKGGQIYHDPEHPSVSLHRRPLLIEDLAEHLKHPTHAAITLTASGARKLRETYHRIEWLLPFQPEEQGDSRFDGPIAFAGTIDYDRKAIPSLLAAAKSLPPGEQILVIGGSRSADFANDRFVKTFQRQIAEQNLGDKFQFTGYLPYGQFMEEVRKCRFILPLVDDYVDSGAYLIKLPAAVPLSLGLGVPMIMSSTVTGEFDKELLSYPGQELAAGLAQARQMDEEAYARLVRQLHDTAGRLHNRNLEKLRKLIGRITGMAQEVVLSTDCSRVPEAPDRD